MCGNAALLPQGGKKSETNRGAHKERPQKRTLLQQGGKKKRNNPGRP